MDVRKDAVRLTIRVKRDVGRLLADGDRSRREKMILAVVVLGAEFEIR